MSDNNAGSLASRMGPVPDEAVKAPPASETAPGIAPPAETKEEAEAENDLVSNRYDVAVKLANDQGDPNSPLYSVKRFEDLGL